MADVTPRILKGFRDYLPDVELARQTMLDTVKAVFESFGFGPLMTPALEYSDILLGKYGDEGEKLLYRFEDNGGRDVALRYDLTVPLARVIGLNRDLPLPFRRYQVAPVWRAEKPGKGRYREFMQCDVDIIGEASVRADAECMIVGLSVLQALGVERFVMRVNNRKILDGLLDTMGVDGSDRRHAVLRAVDKLPKIGREGVTAELSGEVGLDDAAITTLFGVLGLDVKAVGDLDAIDPLVGGTEAGAAGLAELRELLGIVGAAGLDGLVEIDLSIARGLDYYTGTIYETFLRDQPDYGSVMSGGRYDTLLGTFIKGDVPAVGISLGVDRLVAALLDAGLVAARPTPAHAYIALFEAAGYGHNVRLAAALRAHGVKTELALSPGKIGKQFKLAERKGYRWVLLQGSSEREAGVVQIKDLTTGEQRQEPLAEAGVWGRGLAS